MHNSPMTNAKISEENYVYTFSEVKMEKNINLYNLINVLSEQGIDYEYIFREKFEKINIPSIELSIELDENSVFIVNPYGIGKIQFPFNVSVNERKIFLTNENEQICFRV